MHAVQYSQTLVYYEKDTDYSDVTGMFIHPCTMYGIIMNTCSFIDHNLIQRLLLNAQQIRHAVGQVLRNYSLRTDSISYYMNYPDLPLCLPKISWTLNYHLNKIGNIILVAVAPVGYSQEDGIQVNKQTIQDFRRMPVQLDACIKIPTIFYEKNNKLTYSWGKSPTIEFIKRSDMRKYDYSDLDEQGIIKLGAKVKSNSCFMYRTFTVKKSKDVPLETESRISKLPNPFSTQSIIEIEEIDKSKYNDNDKYTDYIVIARHINKVLDNTTTVTIKLRLDNNIKVGDKITSGHSQKGTVSSIVDQSELFHTNDGIYPDIIIGPAYLPSRMTVSHPIEGYSNFMALQEGRFIDSTSHTPLSNFIIEDCLRSAPNKVNVINKDGKPVQNKIEMFFCHYLNLNHFVVNKDYCVSDSSRDFNLQPIKGKEKHGGLRFDIMSRNVISAHGSSRILDNALKVNSDKYNISVDKLSHSLKYTEEQEEYDSCKSTSNFIQLCRGMNINLEIE
jgi:DNA-directed RNA polymerase beta subunit